MGESSSLWASHASSLWASHLLCGRVIFVVGESSSLWTSHLLGGRVIFFVGESCIFFVGSHLLCGRGCGCVVGESSSLWASHLLCGRVIHLLCGESSSLWGVIFFVGVGVGVLWASLLVGGWPDPRHVYEVRGATPRRRCSFSTIA